MKTLRKSRAISARNPGGPGQRKIGFVVLLGLVSLGLSGCETPGRTAMLGAATGAAVGGALHGRGEDALKGAAIGAGAGYVAGKVAQHERRRAYDSGYRRGYYDRHPEMYYDDRYYRY